MRTITQSGRSTSSRVKPSTPRRAMDGEPKPRPMTGFFAHLTEEQKQDALAYRGSEDHGSQEFKFVETQEKL